MFKKLLGKIWRRRKPLGLLLSFLFLTLNALAFRHAWVMTHFVSQGEKTPRPEGLSFLGKVKVLFLGISVPKPENAQTPESLGLPFSTHFIESSDGIRLEAWHIAPAHPQGLVLMFHGYAACKSSQLAEAAAFLDLGYATLLVDLRGSGGSSGNVTTVGVDEADDVARAFAFAQEQWPELAKVLYGQSMGSVAILRAIQEKAIKPAALVIESPFNRLLDTVGNRVKLMGLPSFPIAHLLVFWGGVQHGFNGFQHNPADYAKSVRCPTLVMTGENDTRATLGQVEMVFASLEGEKKLEVFVEAGHESLLKTNPSQWKKAVRDFLSR